MCRPASRIHRASGPSRSGSGIGSAAWRGGVEFRPVNTYSLHNAARILKVAPSRLRYWKRTRLAVPRADSRSSGPTARGETSDYDFLDLVGVKAVISLLERGISLRRIRRSVEVLRELLP